MGKKSTANKMKAFFLFLIKKGNNTSKIIEAIIKGKLETQSLNIQYRILQREPGSSV